MEKQNTDVIIESSKIYSSKAILGFSVFFTTIFGAFLLMQNLKDAGKKKEGNLVLLFSVVFTIVSIIIVNIPDEPKSSLTYLINMAGGGILVGYFQKKYFPNEDNYEKKKIWKPLIVSIIISIPFVWALIYTINNQG
ncbi:MAG: hypothetical protein ABI549_01810 [Flavobacterium sp.]|uniref:hypothetical protein n=1 Tax=Flavobacterium sp. TaxID=239 RepID=UPI0032638AF9